MTEPKRKAARSAEPAKVASQAIPMDKKELDKMICFLKYQMDAKKATEEDKKFAKQKLEDYSKMGTASGECKLNRPPKSKVGETLSMFFSQHACPHYMQERQAEAARNALLSESDLESPSAISESHLESPQAMHCYQNTFT